MQLIDLSIKVLTIPFKVSFDHSAASRSTTEAVLVTATTNNGVKGQGEGCPRYYVTGETLESAQRFFNDYNDVFLGLSTFKQLSDWVAVNQLLIDKNPAAFCAVELALISALAQENKLSIEALLGLCELSGRFRYTAVLGSRKPEVFAGQLQQYLTRGFNDFKVKLFGNPEVDLKNINTLKRSTCNQNKVRFDANNLWSNPNDAIDYMQDLDYPVFALEEPLQVGQYNDKNTVSASLGCRIILDESFKRDADFASIIDTPASWIINIRISKMGGIIRSLAVAKRACALGVPLIIGAQVGETSILTRAALSVANSYRDQIVGQEGAFGTHLLQEDIVEPPIMFGAGGWLNAKEL